jgi:hypothetical protein
MIHEILPVGWLQCNCSIVGDETSGEATVIDPGDEIERVDQAGHHCRLADVSRMPADDNRVNLPPTNVPMITPSIGSLMPQVNESSGIADRAP